ncbi:MAG: hypothetical protein NTZ53_03315 [Cyanobacteria bacterium]|nr:hypothetical protein [Cyanobacteriota bacterium]
MRRARALLRAWLAVAAGTTAAVVQQPRTPGHAATAAGRSFG